MRLNTERTFVELQPFQSVDELNASLSAMRSSEAFRTLTPSARRVFDVLARYSCRYPGVSYRAKTKIAEELGVNRRTVIRACQQLEAAGFIVQHDMKRHNGDRRRTSNAIVFQRFSGECHNGKSQRECHDIKPINKPRESVNITDDTKSRQKSAAQSQVIAEGLAAHLPDVLRQSLAPFLGTDALYRAVGTVYKAKRAVSRDLRIEAHADAFADAIKGVMSAYKRGKVRDLHAVLYAAVNRTARAVHLRSLFAEVVGV